MGRTRARLLDVRFRCPGCLEAWEGVPARVEDAPEDVWHPWRYFAPCPECGTEGVQSPTDRALLKAWAHATGPTTAEGKQRSIEAGTAAAQIPKDPSVLARTRFNALKSGIHARTATFYPARPGKYPQCNGCEYLVSRCWQETACLKRSELFLRHHIAFETRSPELLGELNADLHSNLRALLDDMIITVIGDGARLKTPEWHFDAAGTLHSVRLQDEDGSFSQVYRFDAHPLLKHIKELVQAANLGLSDLGMTPKEKEKADEIRGQLAGQQGETTESLDYQRRQAEALESLGALVRQARDNASRDPILVEYQQVDPGA